MVEHIQHIYEEGEWGNSQPVRISDRFDRKAIVLLRDQYLNNLVSGYFDFAEIQAIRHHPMHMSDYVDQLDRVLSRTGEKVLEGAGKISHRQAMEKAEAEYKKYQVQHLTPVEEAYLDTVKKLEKEAKMSKRDK